MLLVEGFCRNTLNNASRLSQIMEDAKWDPESDNSPETDPVLRSARHVHDAAMSAIWPACRSGPSDVIDGEESHT